MHLIFLHYTEIPHDKLLDILCKVVNFVFKGGIRDYILINKEGCTSWSSKKREHHFISTKSLLKEAIKFLLHNCFLSIGNIIMIQVIGIPRDLTQHHFLQTSQGLLQNLNLGCSRNLVSFMRFMNVVSDAAFRHCSSIIVD